MTPGMMIAAPRSGAGKTTLSLGLMRAFRHRGLAVAGLKCGPDYIDPAFHEAATGRSSANLDSWAMEPSLLSTIVDEATFGADLALCEGLMGLFDGVPGPPGRTGSSADVAAALDWPVLLALDVSGQSQSAGAVALGCKLFDPRLALVGVILNRVGSPRHERLAREAIERVGIPVLGVLPRSAEIALPERHLGLVQAGETAGLDEVLDRLAAFVAAHVDCDRVLALAQASRRSAPPGNRWFRPPAQKIAVARDAAFSFIYPHLLQAWSKGGAEIVFFSPLADESPPIDCDLCWLPGGYPELHAGQIAAAHGFLNGVRKFAETKPVHGECGGYMALGKGLIDASGTPYAMINLLSHVTSFAKRRMSLGYRQATLLKDGPLGSRGARYRGHEFHYATIEEPGVDESFAEVCDVYGSPPTRTGSMRGLASGSFFHLIAPVEAPT